MLWREKKKSRSNMDIIKKDERFYIHDGAAYPRVTWILSCAPMGEGLKRWLGDAESFEETERIKMRAALRGTHVHNGCQRLIEGEELIFEDFTIEEWGMLESFIAWVEDYKPHFIFTEKTVYSEQYGYAGTLDCVAQINGEEYIIDFKTSQNVYPLTMFSQCAAYINAAHEMCIMSGDTKIAILQLGSKHKKRYNFVVAEEPWEHYLDMFKAIKKIFHFEHPKLMPKDKTYKATLKICPHE